MSFRGSGVLPTLDSCRCSVTFPPPPEENCQRLRPLPALWRTLQECQRAMLFPQPDFRPAVIHEGLQMFFGLGDAKHLFDGCAAFFDLVPAIGAKGAHSVFDGFMGHGRSSGAIEDQGTQVFVQNQNFVNALPALVTELPAFFATDSVPEMGRCDIIF